MPFCTKCGTETAENVNFCQKCGNATQGGQNQTQTSNVTPVANTGIEGSFLLDKSFTGNVGVGNLKELSDKWVWTLACVPIFGMILEHIVLNVIGFQSEWAGLFIFFALNVIFVTLDISELKNKGFSPDGWIWFGLFLVPVYLFVRASKTNKHFGYAITWCVLFVLSLFNPITAW